jgi:hypothetical protein
MVETEFSHSAMVAKAYLAENSRPFFWIGLLCAIYGYLPYALYNVPVLLYLGLWMAAISVGVRAFSMPLISSVQIVQQVWTGGLSMFEFIKRLALFAVLAGASIGGTALLGYGFSQLAGLN